MTDANNNAVTDTPEYVLAIPRTELTNNGWGYGVHDFDVDKIDPINFAFLPRDWADDKTPGHDEPNKLGQIMPQVLPYIIVKNEHGDILSYRRKGKEKGLLGRYSIGVGGHVDITDGIHGDDAINILQGVGPYSHNIHHIIQVGLMRELEEEIGLTIKEPVSFHTLVQLDSDKTSQVHVAFVGTVITPEHILTTCNPNEFFEVEWVSSEELFERIQDMDYEPWSKALINWFN